MNFKLISGTLLLVLIYTSDIINGCSGGGDTKEAEVLDPNQMAAAPAYTGSECQDSGSYNKQECLEWKGWNLCGSAEWGTFMKEHCKKSCELCGGTGGGGGSSSGYPTTQLTKHNTHRAKHSATAMTLDTALNTAAQNHADKLASAGKWLSQSDHDSTSGHGENLGISCRSDSHPAYDDVTDAWYSEHMDYDYSAGGKKASCKSNPNCMVGHFTQVVWKASTKLGIGKATGKVGKWFCTWAVGRYTPAGNVGGQYKTNVKAP